MLPSPSPLRTANNTGAGGAGPRPSRYWRRPRQWTTHRQPESDQFAIQVTQLLQLLTSDPDADPRTLAVPHDAGLPQAWLTGSSPRGAITAAILGRHRVRAVCPCRRRPDIAPSTGPSSAPADTPLIPGSRSMRIAALRHVNPHSSWLKRLVASLQKPDDAEVVWTHPRIPRLTT